MAGGPQAETAGLYDKILHDPALKDPRGYIIPADQADFATATKFVNALIKNGIEVMRATSSFQVAGKTYPANSFVVKSAQAGRPFILDMFQPQDHPNDFQYPGGPPIPPYDIAGWTLAYQMGVQFDGIKEGFDGPFTKIPYGQLQPMPVAAVAGPARPAGYLISHQNNNSFILVNRLMKNHSDVYWLKSAQQADGKDIGTGAIWIPTSRFCLADSATRREGTRRSRSRRSIRSGGRCAQTKTRSHRTLRSVRRNHAFGLAALDTGTI